MSGQRPSHEIRGTLCRPQTNTERSLKENQQCVQPESRPPVLLFSTTMSRSTPPMLWDGLTEAQTCKTPDGYPRRDPKDGSWMQNLMGGRIQVCKDCGLTCEDAKLYLLLQSPDLRIWIHLQNERILWRVVSSGTANYRKKRSSHPQ